MRHTLVLVFALFAFNLSAQNPEERQVMDVVNRVFEAMRRSDSTLLKSSFVPQAATYTIFQNQAGETQFREGDLQKFIEAVGNPKEDVWNEPIWNEKVQIDGSLAAVWVDYAFYLNDQFLHCGVDAFQLVKTLEGWKIFHLADTRRKADCEVPEDVRQKYEKSR
ncbi:MAG: nuclear transport factor 2 family protein [Reichenbachiella sp.]|uniref:nuclear transport factor 2 family protein n=1 Tax=Reichenbachiella sp. TaxID=2184521 RepID=UPI003263288D